MPHSCCEPGVQVVNGIAAIIAIQGAGLGLSQAIWSALGVFVSFFWGVAVFGEPVKRMSVALSGKCCPNAGA